jgi:2'-5' RNA ligase
MHVILFFLLSINCVMALDIEDYGVCILVDGEAYAQSLKVKDFYKTKYPEVSSITPHITLVQGGFKDVEQLKKVLSEYAQIQKKFMVTMENKLSMGVVGNTFWDVDKNSDSWQVLQTMTADLCRIIPHPVEHMKWIKRSIQAGTANMDLIKKYGRDFNVPENNRPHITVVYGVQDQLLMDSYIFSQKFSFKAKEVCLVKIDDVGNIKEKVACFPFSEK